MYRWSPASKAWLSLTAEPERSLPGLLCVLAGQPNQEGLTRERDRIRELVLRGTARTWFDYLDDAAALAIAIADGRREGDPETARAVALIVLEHDRMLVGLPGSGYEETAQRRRRLSEAVAKLTARQEKRAWSRP